MDVRIRLVLRIIEEHAGVLHLSSQQLASLLGVGEARLLRLFHAEVGKPFRRHLLEVRMSHAAEMLTDYKLPIKTIASRFGYAAVSNFYRDFKIVHGTSPVRMRQLKMCAEMAASWPIAFPAGSSSGTIQGCNRTPAGVLKADPRPRLRYEIVN
jgi:AraC-like DNA-binding protein